MKSDAGFTFLEVMVAFSIISLVLVGIFQLQTQSIALGSHARFNAMAPFLAKQKITEILSDPENFSLSANGDFGEDLAEYRWRVEMSDIESDYFGETAKRFKKIVVFIETEEQDNRYRLETYYFFDQEL